MDITAALLAAVPGFGAEVINFFITRSALRAGRSPVMSLRILVTAAVVVLTYLAGRALGFPAASVLIGCAAGMTIGLVLFTVLLFKDARGK